MNLTIVLPVRNEAENIVSLQQRIMRTFGEDLPQIIYVDDSSDNTGETILQSGYPLMKYIHRDPEERTGLLSATVWGLSKAESRYVAVMDADGQHPPEVLPAMVDLLRIHDYVGATRFGVGGKIDGLDGLHRKILSSTLRYMPRLMLGLPLSDPLTSMCVFRKEYVNFDKLFAVVRPRMMKIQPALLVTASFPSVVELPIQFAPREKGQSKMDTKQGIAFFKEMFWLWQFQNQWGLSPQREWAAK